MLQEFTRQGIPLMFPDDALTLNKLFPSILTVNVSKFCSPLPTPSNFIVNSCNTVNDETTRPLPRAVSIPLHLVSSFTLNVMLVLVDEEEPFPEVNCCVHKSSLPSSNFVMIELQHVFSHPVGSLHTGGEYVVAFGDIVAVGDVVGQLSEYRKEMKNSRSRTKSHK